MLDELSKMYETDERFNKKMETVKEPYFKRGKDSILKIDSGR